MRSLLGGFFLGCAGAAGDSPLVEIANGQASGFDREAEGQTVSTFHSLPFAQPPVGALRFAYPEPYTQKWTGVRDATQVPDMCTQSAGELVKGSEDCLFVSVYTPRKALDGKTSKLPVMFWIFGGGFTAGDLYAGGLYDGANLVGRHDLVMVAVNYRVMAMGFSTYIPGPNGEVGSAAMADQRMGMQWTQDNIANFGGDPSQVTIFGESAGAFSVMYHLVSPPSWPLFSKAILESTTSASSWFYQPHDEAVGLYEGWADGVGCPSGGEQLACLQAKPASAFAKTPTSYMGRSPLYGIFPVGPVVDGSEHGLLDVPINLVRAGKIAQVPIILGANKDGGSMFEPLIGLSIPSYGKKQAETMDDVSALLGYIYTPEDASKIIKTYPASEFTSAKNKYQKLVEQAVRDNCFRCSDRELATAWTAAGLDVYLYTFSFNFGPLLNTVVNPLGLALGDAHAIEMPFVFNNALDIFKKLPFVGKVQEMSDIMSCQWASFAYGGSPNGESKSSPICDKLLGKVKNWPRFGDSRSFYSLRDSAYALPKPIELRSDNTYPDDEFPSDNRCDMWNSVEYVWKNHSSSIMV